MLKSNDFYAYFFDNIPKDISSFIRTLIAKTNVFLFSGVIRDYFVRPEIKKFRDIDLIIEDDLRIELIFKDLVYHKNSFGGYKITFGEINIDLWVIKNTWALNNGQLKFNFDYIDSLPKTTFFNFSSILYCFKDKKFIIGKDFLRFIRDRKIEIVSAANPYPELCIVNSFYYEDKLQLPLGEKIKDYIHTNYHIYQDLIEPIQIKHFRQILYSREDIEKKIQFLYK